MSAALNELTDRVMELSTDERAILAQKIWNSIDDFIDPNTEQEWLDEAERRWLEIEQGSVQCISAEEAMSKARNRLKK
jgi:putative addiction module component (TIGR02574 family)